MARRRLLSSIVGCALDCAKWKNGIYFCDPNTRNCELCIDICRPSRGTLDECRDQIQCKDLWNMSSSTSFNGDAPLTPTEAAAVASTKAVSASIDLHLHIVTPILVIVCVLVLVILVFVLIRRKLRTRDHRTERVVVYKLSVPVSTEEQNRENNHLNAAAAAIENCAHIYIPAEVEENALL